jgi:hypothetical protein
LPKNSGSNPFKEIKIMDLWDILSNAAWLISAALLIWIVKDAISVSQQYDEQFLMSSREGDE